MQRVKLPDDWMTPLLKIRYSSDETSSGSGGGYMSPDIVMNTIKDYNIEEIKITKTSKELQKLQKDISSSFDNYEEYNKLLEEFKPLYVGYFIDKVAAAAAAAKRVLKSNIRIVLDKGISSGGSNRYVIVNADKLIDVNNIEQYHYVLITR
jgi:hypothetical protein